MSWATLVPTPSERGVLSASTRLNVAFVLPASVWLVIFFALPLLVVIGSSITTADGYGDPSLPLTLHQYSRVVDGVYVSVIGKSLAIGLGVVLVALPIALIASIALMQFPVKVRRALLLVIIVPSWINLLVKNYAWIVLLGRAGLLNEVLVELGIIGAPISFIFNNGAVLLGLAHTYIPFAVLPIFAALEGIDSAWVDTARDLGAGPLRLARDIYIPNARNGVLVGGVLVFVPAFGAFVTPDLLGGAKGMMIANLLENQILQVRNFPFASAIAIATVFAIALLIVGITLLTGRRAASVSGS